MEISKEKLEAFFTWLKNDGLPPKKSERLWRKTITGKLLNHDKMTVDNFEDFLKDYNQQLESKKYDKVSFFDPKVMIGITLKIYGSIKTVHNSVDADSYMHLFFDDGSDSLVSKIWCQKILESQK